MDQFYRKMLWAGAYPLLLALMAGAVWVDRTYAQSARHATGAALSDAMHTVSERLLVLSAGVVAAGVLAAWLQAGAARLLLLASLAVFCLEFLLPVLAAMLPGGTIYLAQLGPVLRLGILLGALGLALLATHRAVS